jgi:hypothetical protein
MMRLPDAGHGSDGPTDRRMPAPRRDACWTFRGIFHRSRFQGRARSLRLPKSGRAYYHHRSHRARSLVGNLLPVAISVLHVAMR